MLYSIDWDMVCLLCVQINGSHWLTQFSMFKIQVYCRELTDPVSIWENGLALVICSDESKEPLKIIFFTSLALYACVRLGLELSNLSLIPGYFTVRR